MDKTKTVWGALAGSFIRALLTVIGAFLMRKGLIDQALLDRLLTEGTAELLGFALVGAMLLWSMRDKIIGFLKVHIGLLSAPKTTSAQVDTAVSNMPIGDKLKVALTEAEPDKSVIPGAYAPPQSS